MSGGTFTFQLPVPPLPPFRLHDRRFFAAMMSILPVHFRLIPTTTAGGTIACSVEAIRHSRELGQAEPAGNRGCSSGGPGG